MFGPIGMPELIIILSLGVFWLIPLVAGTWALVTLHRIRLGQQALGSQLERIASLLQAHRPAGGG
jgi:hypothetical protein